LVHTLWIFAFLIGHVLLGCGSSRPPPKVDRSRIQQRFDELEGRGSSVQSQAPVAAAPRQGGPRPEWVITPTRDPAFYHGIGSSAVNWQDARTKAIGDLAQDIKVQVTSLIKDYIEEKGYSGRQGAGSVITTDFRSEVELLAQQTITDYEIADQWSGGGDHWILLRLSREQVRRKMQKEWDDAVRLAADHYRAGLRDERLNMVEALKSYAKGLIALRKFLGQPVEVTVGGKNVLLNNEIERAMSRVIGAIDLVAEGDTRLKARVGKTMNQDLSVRLSHNGRPLSALPIRFSFTKGQGELVEKAHTDASGRAATRIYKIITADPANTIEARIDIEQLTGQNASELQSLGQKLERIGAQRVLFYVSTTEYRILVQIEESNLGNVVSDAYFSNFIKNQVAAKTGATFTDHREEANFIIEGRASSRYSSKQGNIHFCYATASVRFKDLKTGEELYSNKVDRIKGYALDQNEAGLKAVEKAVSQIGQELMKYVTTEMGP